MVESVQCCLVVVLSQCQVCTHKQCLTRTFWPCYNTNDNRTVNSRAEALGSSAEIGIEVRSLGNCKIVIIGGGSYIWGPTLVSDFGLEPDLSGELWLMDIAQEPLDISSLAAERILREHESQLEIHKTTDIDEALTDADYVVLTITTGGLAAMKNDLEIPEKYGIYHSVGDTTGPAGLVRSLRNVPVIVDICQRMEKLCPNAWMFNLTNPMATMCRAATKYTAIKTIGLCHELYYTLKDVSELIGVSAGEIDVTHAGVNHFSWITRMDIGGKDGLSLLRNAVNELDSIPDSQGTEEQQHRKGRLKHNRAKLALLDVYGALPAAGDRHLVEFFPNFLTDPEDCSRRYAMRLDRIPDRLAWRERSRQQVLNMIDGSDPVPKQRSPETLSTLTAALANHRSAEEVIDIPNCGQIDNLPREAIVETLGVVGPRIAAGKAMGSMPDGIQTMLQRQVMNQELTVTAAMSGDRKLALQALLNDPMTCRFEQAESLLDELIQASSQFLPRFC